MTRNQPLKAQFEEVKMLLRDDHLSRRLLRCRECGQLYFYEFYEEIDWDEGKDPQYQTYIPVPTSEAAEQLMRLSVFEIAAYDGPSLRSDFPKTAKKPRIYWAHRESAHHDETMPGDNDE
ncbi:MAG TPA: hypothetical protein VFA95_11585 [Gammaproteobacteria bacterium]|nr:hypothetical protein [Gammaproteobacteria bacterium]